MRHYGCNELERNANRRIIIRVTAMVTRCHLPKILRKDVEERSTGSLTNYPDGEDETSLEVHRTSLITEMRRAAPDAAKLTKLMDITYARRRLEINEALRVATILEKWPAPFRCDCAGKPNIVNHLKSET